MQSHCYYCNNCYLRQIEALILEGLIIKFGYCVHGPEKTNNAKWESKLKFVLGELKSAGVRVCTLQMHASNGCQLLASKVFLAPRDS